MNNLKTYLVEKKDGSSQKIINVASVDFNKDGQVIFLGEEKVVIAFFNASEISFKLDEGSSLGTEQMLFS
jgi:hypothetical protein